MIERLVASGANPGASGPTSNSVHVAFPAPEPRFSVNFTEMPRHAMATQPSGANSAPLAAGAVKTQGFKRKLVVVSSRPNGLAVGT